MLTPEKTFLSAYCERMGDPAFLAEPLNALTNAGFLIAAVLALVAWRKARGNDWPTLALALIAALIGVGSFLFHTVPNRITVMMDVLPIQAFILAYVALATRRYLGASVAVSIAAPVVFFLGSGVFVAAMGSAMLGGGIGYVPALLALIGYGIAVGRRGGEVDRAMARSLLIAAAVFALSLTLRTLDRPMCGSIPVGLHFLWHLLNSVVIGTLVLAAIRHRQMTRAGAVG